MLQIRKIKVLKHCDPFKTNFVGLNGKMADFFCTKCNKNCQCALSYSLSALLFMATLFIYPSFLAKIEGKDGLTATFFCLSPATFHFLIDLGSPFC